jgi:integrase/recombinase XerD
MSKTTSSLPEDRSVTLDVAVEQYLADEQLSGKSAATIQAHRNALQQFGKFWGRKDLREATAGDLDTYAREVLGRVSRETAYAYLAPVRALFRHLAVRNVLLIDPSRLLPMPRMANRPLGRILSQDEMKRLLESSDVTSTVGLRDRALLELLYSTGLRLSEVQKLRIADIGEDAVTVRQGKGAKDRVVPLGKQASEWVRKHIHEARPPGVEEVFVTLRGRPFGKGRLRQVIHGLGVRAGIPEVTCHAIRRTMATALLRAGANPKEVSEILGHGDLKSLSRYIRIAAREVKETHRKTHPREGDR